MQTKIMQYNKFARSFFFVALLSFILQYLLVFCFFFVFGICFDVRTHTHTKFEHTKKKMVFERDCFFSLSGASAAVYIKQQGYLTQVHGGELFIRPMNLWPQCIYAASVRGGMGMYYLWHTSRTLCSGVF